MFETMWICGSLNVYMVWAWQMFLLIWKLSFKMKQFLTQTQELVYSEFI